MEICLQYGLFFLNGLGIGFKGLPVLFKKKREYSTCCGYDSLDLS